MIVLPKEKGDALYGYILPGGAVMHSRYDSKGGVATRVVPIHDKEGNPHDIVTGSTAVVACDDHHMFDHGLAVLAYQDFKKNDHVAYTHGKVLQVAEVELKHMHITDIADKKLVLEPKGPKTSADIALMFSTSDKVKGHHGVAQFCLPTSLEDQANVKLSCFGPFKRGQSDEFQFVTDYVTPNNKCKVAQRTEYECGLVAIATKEIKTGDALFYYDKRAHPIYGWSADLTPFELDVKPIMDGTTELTKVQMFKRRVVAKKTKIHVDDDASDIETDAKPVRKYPILANQSVIGEAMHYQSSSDEDVCKENQEWTEVDHKRKVARAAERLVAPTRVAEAKPSPAKAAEAKPSPAKAAEAKPSPAKAAQAKPGPAKAAQAISVSSSEDEHARPAARTTKKRAVPVRYEDEDSSELEDEAPLQPKKPKAVATSPLDHVDRTAPTSARVANDSAPVARVVAHAKKAPATGKPRGRPPSK